MVDELRIRDTLARYCHLIDDGRFDELVELFTIEGAFAFGRLGAVGREELRAWFEEMQPLDQRGKHLTTNVVVEVDGDRATAVSDFVFLAFKDRRLVPLVAGRYRDDLVCVEGRWLIGRRESEQLEPSDAAGEDR